MRAIFLIAVILATSAACYGQSTRTYSSSCGLGARWEETENGWNGTWTRRGNSNIFDAAWRNGSATGSSVLTMTLNGNRVHIERRDSGSFGGATVTYDGTISSNGTVTGTGHASTMAQSYSFSANITCG